MVENQPELQLEILFESEYLIAINKQHGLLVHKSPIAKDATEFALQKVRNFVGKRVYLVHRLDRKTSGVLVFAKDKISNEYLQSSFRNREIDKEYLAIVRGHITSEGTINYALKNENKTQEALTHFQCLEQFEIPIPSNGFETSRFSYVKLIPKTGRHHQLRKHMAHINHPIIGDRPHGCNKQNKFWKERFDMNHMMLHANSIQFQFKDEVIKITAPFSSSFLSSLELLKNLNQQNGIKIDASSLEL